MYNPIGAMPVRPGGPDPTAARGRFRLTAMGFAVERQSYDTIDESDGRGDEVYVRGDAFEFDHAGGQLASTSVQTGVIGHRGFLLGGSGRAGLLDVSGDGGLVTGDRYPNNSPWRDRTTTQRANDLPLIIWEGELVSGGNGVVVVPTIWEWDGHGATIEESRWAPGLAAAVADQSMRISNIIGAWPAGQNVPIFDDFLSMWLTNQGTRPIGSSRRPGVQAFSPIGHTIPMQIDPIILTYESAANVLARPFSYTTSSSDGSISTASEASLPRGTFWVRFIDGQDMQGDYTLFVKLEQLP